MAGPWARQAPVLASHSQTAAPPLVPYVSCYKAKISLGMRFKRWRKPSI